ncbi:hypothetical protein FQA47_007659 [Oryzias melastigma]|uniref:Uncharacterized protein n=1 Tax=Oryzias melastigma TaxID=30732 RepID=A0A834C3G4_ORYME|nr:hypothetical protein FQA47_007659 [Oryzias melastigma]
MEIQNNRGRALDELKLPDPASAEEEKNKLGLCRISTFPMKKSQSSSSYRKGSETLSSMLLSTIYQLLYQLPHLWVKKGF